MGQALSSFVANLCGDTDQDEFQSSTRSSHTHIFPQRPGPQLIQTPLSWSRGSDSFTHPVTNSVTNRIVRNPPPGSDPEGDSSSWTLSQLSFGLGHPAKRAESDSVRQLGRDPALRWPRGSDSFIQPVTNSVTNRIVRNHPPGSDPNGDSSSWTPEVRQLSFDLGHHVKRDESNSVRQLGRDHALRWSRGSDSFIQPVTNSVTNRIVRNPPPGSDPDGDSSLRTREVSQLGHGHHVTRDESDSASQLRRDPAITLPKWLDVSLKDSSITVLEEKKEVVREVSREERERYEERGRGAKVGEMDEVLQQFPKDTAGG